MPDWVLPYFSSLLAFAGTLLYLRLTGRIVRRFFAKNQTVRWDNLKIALIRIAPTVSVGLVLLFLRNVSGWTWVSTAAIWVSFIWDALQLACALYFVFKLRQLRREPNSFFYEITVKPYDDWAGTNLKYTTPFRFWGRGNALPFFFQPFSFLLTKFGTGKSSLNILYGDFQRFLNGDFRFVDVFDDLEGTLGFSSAELESIPHLAVKDAQVATENFKAASRTFGVDTEEVEKEFEEEINERRGKAKAAGQDYDLQAEDNFKAAFSSKAEGSRREKIINAFLIDKKGGAKRGFRASSKHFLINRAVNTALPADLWEASCRLCQTPPAIIAETWKQYHFQEDIRLRLVMMFNAADLMQRLIGAMILQMLEEIGELNQLRDREDFPRDKKSGKIILPPASAGEWNRLLQWILKNSESPQLESFRSMLILPKSDFVENVRLLTPFWQILRTSPHKGEQNTLAKWSILSLLRNKTVGHGAIGWKLQLRPAVYLTALHQFFLNSMREAAELDLGIVAVSLAEGDGPKIVPFSQGLLSALKIDDSFQVAVKNPVNDEILNLYPYLRFHNNRLVIIDKASKKGDKAVYVDYNPANIAEPSFIEINIDSPIFTTH